MGRARGLLLASMLAGCAVTEKDAPPILSQPVEPFSDVVCRVEAESAELLKQALTNDKPGPMSAKVLSASELRPWRGMGVAGPPEPDEYDLAFQKLACGGKVLMVYGRGRPAHSQAASPFARLSFRVPEEGDYYLFIKGVSWCCGCQSLTFRIDGKPGRALGSPLWQGWWHNWAWRSLKVNTSGVKRHHGLPEPFRLRAGQHHLELVMAWPLCYGVALDELVLSRLATERTASKRVLSEQEPAE